jgi:hypothetical protein
VVSDAKTAVSDLHKCQAVENLQARVDAPAFGMLVELPYLFRVMGSAVFGGERLGRRASAPDRDDVEPVVFVHRSPVLRHGQS